MYFVPATQAASSGSFGLLLVLFITALLIAQNRANEKAKSESDHRLRMQAGLEATLAKLNPNFTPERKKGVTDADPSEAFQALLKHAASEKMEPAVAVGDVIGAAAP